MIKKDNYLEIVLGMMILSVFLSKSLFNLMFGIIVIIAILKYFKQREIYKNNIFYYYLALIPLGIISNIINSGFDSIGNFFESERSLIYILIFMMLNLSYKQYERIKNYILIGGIVSAIYSTISLFTPKIFGIKTLYYEYQRTNKMESFQNGIRWARLLQIMVSFSFISLEWAKNKVQKILFLLLSMFFIWNIVINGQRAAILGAVISFFTFFFMYVFSLKKDRMGYIITIILLLAALGYSVSIQNKMIKERVTSIFQLDKNISNKVRIGYWRMGLDMLKESSYLGVGSGNIPYEFQNFIDSKSKSYRKKHYQFHEGTAFENNYINLAVENGLVYLIAYLIFQVSILVKIFKGYLNENSRNEKVKIMVIFSLLLGDRIFMFFYPRTDSYVEVLIIFLMFYGMKIIELNNNK